MGTAWLWRRATQRNPKTGNDLSILPARTRVSVHWKPLPFVQTPFNESQAAFSPDGHWGAYQSNESGPIDLAHHRDSQLEAAGREIEGGRGEPVSRSCDRRELVRRAEAADADETTPARE